MTEPDSAALNRADRLLSILVALQDQHWQRAADMAELFDVSTRTIYRDMQALEEAGVQVEAVPGKGYRLFEGYLLPPLMFTTEEAAVLKLGVDYMAQHFDAAYRAAARAAGMKLGSVLSEAHRAVIDRLQETIRFVPVNAFDNPAEQAMLKTLGEAITAQHSVTFRQPPDADARTFDPYSLVHLGGMWHLVGHDHSTGRVQHLRLDRLADLSVTTASFERPAGYRPTTPADDTRGIEVQVLFAPAVADWVAHLPSFYVEHRQRQADGLLVTLRVRRVAEVLPWLLSWGAHAYVLEPPALRHRLAQEAERIAARYRAETLMLT